MSAPLLSGCTQGAPDSHYAAAASRVWQPLAVPAVRPGNGSPLPSPPLARELVHELVRCATLAPSSHNTQCWRFVANAQGVSILPDLSRRCPAVDPDDHHLFVSLGCAAENLAQAALANGLMAQVWLDTAAGDRVMIGLAPTRAATSPQVAAIATRQCTRGDFDSQPVSGPELRLLEQAGTGNGVQVVLLTAKPAIEHLLGLVTQGNTVQLQDPAFVAELKAWIRFNAADAIEAGDGLYSGLSGNPAFPKWLGSRLFELFLKPDSDNDKYARQVRSSAGLAVFLSNANDKAHWVETGRCYQRFALQAAALGIRNAMLNQAVEVPALRHQLASFMGTPALRPDLVVRFGRGPLLQRSLRRPVAAVLVQAPTAGKVSNATKAPTTISAAPGPASG